MGSEDEIGILLDSRAKEGWEFMFAAHVKIGTCTFIYRREIEE